MCCEELFTKRPVHRLYAYVRKKLASVYAPPPHIFPTKILVIAYSCDDLLRKLQRGVCIFSFSFFTTCVEVIMYTQTL